MKRYINKETAIVILLFLTLVMFVDNYVQPTTAQGPAGPGFWFMRKPQVPDHIVQGAREGLTHEINRLTELATIPAGATDITDYVGNPVVWDQTQIDAVNAEIVRLQALLTQF